MDGIIGNLLTYLGQLFLAYWPWIAAAAVATIIGAIGLSRLARLYRRWREGETFWSFQPRYLFKAKAKLLANKVLRELYEPSAQHIIELDEGQRPGPQLAWLHPYPAAIRSTVKFNRAQTRGGKKRLNAAQQIAELSDWIRVETLPSFAFFAGDEKDHYAVKLIYNGEKTQEEMENLTKIVERVLSAHSVDVLDTKNTSALTLVVHIEEPENPLVEHGVDHAWLDDHPARSPKSLPVAITGDGTQQWNFPTHHTVCLALTGGGKASVLHAIARQYGRFVVEGSVVLHGADGKAWEMRPYQKVPGLFKEVAYEVDEVAEMIFDLKEQMEQRARSMDIDLENMKAEASVDPAPEHPWHILIIDELWDVLDEMGLKHPAYQALNSIARKGRALGFFIITFTQTVELSEIGNLRKNFVNKIAGSQDSKGFNAYMLGEDAADRGFDSTAIPESTPANGYRYSGIFYAKGEGGDPQLVRFAYSHGDEVLKYAVEIQKQLQAKGKAPALAARPSSAPSPTQEALPEMDDFQW